MDTDEGGQGFQAATNGSGVFSGNPRYAQEYAQQLAEAQQAAAEEQHERLYGAALRAFWESTGEEVDQLAPHDLGQFKNHQLPLARIKKIMKSDEDVRMISAEAPVLFAKACELFILELTLRSWAHAEEGRRRTLQRSDVAAAISKDEAFDFLADIVPQEDAEGPADGPADAAAAAVPSLPGAYGSGGGGYGAGGHQHHQQQQQQQQQPQPSSSDPSWQQSGEASGL